MSLCLVSRRSDAMNEEQTAFLVSALLHVQP